MAKYCEQRMRSGGQFVTLLDLGGHGGPDGALEVENMQSVRSAFRQASHLVFAVPIHVYDVASPAKRLVERLSEAELGDRVVGFLCAAGGHRSYMSVMSFANSLMLDFRCWIAPRFVYATPEDFRDQAFDATLVQRIDQLCRDLMAFRPTHADVAALPVSATGQSQPTLEGT